MTREALQSIEAEGAPVTRPEPGSGPDEQERLRALERYAVLDTPPDPRFDRITRLASRLLGAPICVVSLVDAERQWFKSRVGLDAIQTPREVAFCAYTIQSDEVFVVEDATKDERFRNNPLVLGQPAIRFYGGAPLRTPDGHRIGTLCVIDRVPRGMDAEQQQVLRDLAAIVVDELEFRFAEQQLSERVAQLEATESRLSSLALRLERTNDDLEQFAYFASHDLQAPLRHITSFVDLLRIRLEGQLDEKSLTWMNFVRDGAAQMHGLIGGILAYSRAGRAGTSMEDVPLGDVASSVATMLNEGHVGAPLEVVCHDLPTVHANRIQVRQLLQNLCQNARRYARPGVPARVELSVQLVDDRWALQIADNGMGIDAENLAKVFEPFSKVQAEGSEGHGIGLAICSKIARNHGGEIALSSQPGEGSCFVVSFERARGHAA